MVAPTRYVAVGDFIALRRTLRRWSTSRARPAVMSRGRVQGGWVLVNDGPAMASQLARALSLRARPSAAAEAVAWSISVRGASLDRAGSCRAVGCSLLGPRSCRDMVRPAVARRGETLTAGLVGAV